MAITMKEFTSNKQEHHFLPSKLSLVVPECEGMNFRIFKHWICTGWIVWLDKLKLSITDFSQ